MARYVYLVKYTPEALQAVREDGEASRVTVLEHLIESVGGRPEQMYFVNSPEWHFVNIAEVHADAAFAISTQLLWTQPGAG